MLRAQRTAARLSQRALADRAGVPQSTIARIESGTLTPRMDTFERILAAMDLTMSARPAYGRGIDRTLVRRMLALEPAERIAYAAASGTAIESLRRAVGASGGI